MLLNIARVHDTRASKHARKEHLQPKGTRRPFSPFETAKPEQTAL